MNKKYYRHTEVDYGLSLDLRTRPAKRSKKWTILSLALIGGFMLKNGISPDESEPTLTTQNVAHELKPLLLAQERPSSLESTLGAPLAPPKERTINVAVKSGDTLAKIFEKQGLDQVLLHELTEDKTVKQALTKIHPGQELVFTTNAKNDLLRFEYNVNELERLVVNVKEGKADADIVDRHIEELHTFADVVIHDSLFMSAERAGLNHNIIMELARVFGWDIDFALDIQKGDKFSVIYEDRYVDGEKITPGDIIAAEFVNNGKTYRAIRYESADGHADYYTPEGRSMRQAFLRTPVEFTRISSKFNPNRRHPILHSIRAHRGVDYAAPTGTPVRAASDGVISLATTQRGYGKVVEIKHGSTYSTLYAHLNGFAKGIRNGVSVKQGQVIGYVGKTGMATGPHLHYEFRVNGVHKDPLTVELPRSHPINSKYKNQFLAHASDVLKQLSNYQSIELAAATPTAPEQGA